MKIGGLSGSFKLGGLAGLPTGGSQPSLGLGDGLKLGGLSGLTLPTPSAAARQEKNSEVPPLITSSVVLSKLPPLSGPLLMPTLPSGSWECSCCMLQNKPEATSCIACGAAKPTSHCTSQLATELSGSGQPKAVASSSFDNQAKIKGMPNLSETKLLAVFAPSSGWECQVCLVMNKTEDVKCVACSSPKAGASSSSDGGSSSSVNLFQQKPQATLPVVFGDGGGIKLSLGGGGGGLTIAGVASLSSSASKKEEPPVKLGLQPISFGGMSAVSATTTTDLSSKLSANGGAKASEAGGGGLKIEFTGTLPAFSSDGLQLGTSKDTAKTTGGNLPSQPTFSLGATSFGAGVGTSSGTEFSKAQLGGSLFAATRLRLGEVTGGIKFAVPPAGQDTPKSSAAGGSISTVSSQPPLSFNLNALANSSSQAQCTSDGGSGQKPFQLSGLGQGSIQPNFQSFSSTSSTEPHSTVSSISFAVPSSGRTSLVEPTTAASTIKLAAAPLQGTQSSMGLFSSQPPALTFAGSSFGSAMSQTSAAAGATLTFAGSSFGSAMSQTSAAAGATLTFAHSSGSVPTLQQSLPTFGSTSNPISSQPSAPLFASQSLSLLAGPASTSSSSTLFNSVMASSNVSFNFSAGKLPTTADSALKLGIPGTAGSSSVAPPPTFKFGSQTSEVPFNFNANLQTAAPSTFSANLQTAAPSTFSFGASAAAPGSSLTGTFPSNLDTSTKAPNFPKMAADMNPQINAGLIFGGASSLQQMPQGGLGGGGMMFSSTPGFAFSGMTAGKQQQQQLSSINVAPGVFGSGLVGTSIAGQQQTGAFVFGGGQNVPQFGIGGGVPSLSGGVPGSQFVSTPLLGQAAATDLSSGSNIFAPGPPASHNRVIKKAIRKKPH